ncbi:hypothetical protein SAMN02910298_02929 [Pseudobutyrivibrio sp. YE44]|uniref:hypothetical protein n=1 Tax=Pseudobutyrivibrio sp. YE44 TaxID=1520802 RepID=UPI00088CEA4B|nr:hypothetical protein [Pseudobutyrivibrio sp. YE44]SDB56822.1 hypothetical protein SAMN02910298_02929 [Pseudobutyrivibrio sp. YE44]
MSCRQKIKKKIIIIIFIFGAIVIAMYSAYYKMKLKSLTVDFYERNNFGFNSQIKEIDVEQLVSPDAVWFVTDLADYREVSDASSNPIEWDSNKVYFSNEDGSLNWNNIKTWMQDSEIKSTSIEYDVLAEMMIDMSDDDIEKIVELGQVKSPNHFGYELTDNVKHLASIYVLKAKEIENKDEIQAEPRALGFLQTLIEIENLSGEHCSVDISRVERDYYSFQIRSEGVIKSDLYSPQIIVSNRLWEMDLDFALDDVYSCNSKELKKIQSVLFLEREQVKAINRLLLDIGNDAMDMKMTGYVINVNRGGLGIAYLADVEFRDEALLEVITEYNERNNVEMTIEEMKEHYLKYDDVYLNYFAL